MVERKKQSKLHPSDQELLPPYLLGKNEPVGTWIDLKYFPRLWVFATAYLRNDKHRAKDALHDTALKMCEWKTGTRPHKFVTDAQQVPNALHNQVRTSIFQIIRRKYYQEEQSTAPDQLTDQHPEDTSLIELSQKLETQKEMLRSYFTQRGQNDEMMCFEQLLAHGHKARSIMIAQTASSEEEVHALLIRVRRHLKKFQLQLAQKNTTNE